LTNPDQYGTNMEIGETRRWRCLIKCSPTGRWPQRRRQIHIPAPAK
jgi:hypothetical protein